MPLTLRRSLYVGPVILATICTLSLTLVCSLCRPQQLESVMTWRFSRHWMPRALRLWKNCRVWQALILWPFVSCNSRTPASPRTSLISLSGRLLRYMASVGLVRQNAADKFEANSKCHHLAAPEAITIVTHLYVLHLNKLCVSSL